MSITEFQARMADEQAAIDALERELEDLIAGGISVMADEYRRLREGLVRAKQMLVDVEAGA